MCQSINNKRALGLRSWVRTNGPLLVQLLGSVVWCPSGGPGSPGCSETNSGASRPAPGPGRAAPHRCGHHRGLWGGDRKNAGSYTRAACSVPEEPAVSSSAPFLKAPPNPLLALSFEDGILLLPPALTSAFSGCPMPLASLKSPVPRATWSPSVKRASGSLVFSRFPQLCWPALLHLGGSHSSRQGSFLERSALLDNLNGDMFRLISGVSSRWVFLSLTLSFSFPFLLICIIPRTRES